MDNDSLIVERIRLTRHHRNGSGWFYWIAGLTLINVIMTIINGNWSFVFGLGVTDLIYYITQELSSDFGNTALILGLAVNLFLLSIFLLLGRSAKNGRNWSFIVGFILYGLDALLLAYLTDYMGAIFHLYPLYCIFKGLQANRSIAAIDAELSQTSYNVNDTSQSSHPTGQAEDDNLTEVQRNFRQAMEEYKRGD